MKTVVASLCGAIVFLVLDYLVLSFVKADWWWFADIFQWKEYERAGFLFWHVLVLGYGAATGAFLRNLK